MTVRGFIVLFLAVMLGIAPGLAAAPVMAQDGPVVVAEGFNLPQGVLVAEDGSIWVVDGGVGGENEVEAISPQGELVTATFGDTGQVVRLDADGTRTVVATLPSLLIGDEATAGGRLAVLDGAVYVTNGVWISDGSAEDEPLPGTAVVFRINDDGSVTEVVETWTIEKEENPAGGIVDTHPYGLAAGPDGKLWIADSGANTLMVADPSTGELEVVAVFDPLPGVFPNPALGGEMLTDPVPTGIAFDDDGNALVALLSGFPFIPGSAKVLKVTPDGAVSVYAEGLTMLTDLRRGPDGEYYGVQFAVFTDQGPEFGSGAIVRIVEGGESVPVVTGLAFPTSVDFNADGDAYITIFGGGPPGAGQLVMVAGVAGGDGAAEAAATPVATEEPAEEAAATPVATEEPAEEAAATPVATEEPAEEAAATPVPTEEPAEEAAATPVATEEPAEEAAATPVPTEEPAEEPAATPVPTEEPAEEVPAPETMPETGAGGVAGIVTAVLGVVMALAGGVALRRRNR